MADLDGAELAPPPPRHPIGRRTDTITVLVMSDGVVRMIATSGFFTDRVHQIRFQPPPRWGSLQRSPRLSSWFNGDPTSKGKGREMEVGERGRPLAQIPGFAPDSVIHLAIMQPCSWPSLNLLQSLEQSSYCRCPHSMRCRVYVTVRCPSVCPSVSPTAAAFRSTSVAGAQQRAGSVDALIRGGSTPADSLKLSS